MKKLSDYYVGFHGFTRTYNPECYEFSINCILALCDIINIDDTFNIALLYERFSYDLKSLVGKEKTNIDTVIDIALGKKVFGKKSFKEFVKKYHKLFEIMEKNHVVYEMTMFIYYGNDSDYSYLNKYIINNINKMDVLRDNLNKLLKLGFDKIYFNENIKFNDNSYYYNSYSSDLFILENMKVMPSYSKGYIEYKSDESKYCLLLNTTGYGNKKSLTKYFKRIILNDLFFDSSILPDELTIENTEGLINSLIEQDNDNYELVKKCVDLDIKMDDLISQFENTKTYFENIPDFSNPTEIYNTLLECRRMLNKLRIYELKYQKDIIESTDNITSELLEKEKSICLKRREASYYD